MARRLITHANCELCGCTLSPPPGAAAAHPDIIAAFLLPPHRSYCEFDDNEHFREYYNLTADPYNADNLVAATPAPVLAALSARLRAFMLCSGDSCTNPAQ